MNETEILSKENAYKKIQELIEKFESHYDSYHKADYNETLTRQDFINPFFSAFGWDVDNKNGYAQSFRDVIHEDKIKVGKETKAPDYSFRIGGRTVFFVEAKKPSVNIIDNAEPAYQLRRYGWSAKLSISILTDFQELAIYDCLKKPKENDKAGIARVKYINYKDYLKEFDFLWGLFAKEEVLKGSLEKYALAVQSKKGTEGVDGEFLSSLDELRNILALNISKLNTDFSNRDINFAVQQTIDRIIFLRIAEDREIEHYGKLKEACNGESYYKNLYEIFLAADSKYNSGLFNLEKDNLSKNLNVDNKVIKEIILDLYYPKSPYEFSVLPVEILGSAYEQFLGKTITISASGKVKIEEKPEVRKAGGVYYTPEYIVNYIVENTVGELIKNKTPKEIEKIKIVDPSCGSGSFLLGAYKYLLDYHKDYYTKNIKTQSRGLKTDYLTPLGELATWVKKRILLNNIYGVDIDVNAVEVTKLSLLLKCLEKETTQSLQNEMALFNERALPSLEDNIKCGNSLIGFDFYSQGNLDLDEEAAYKINCFDWEKSFPEVFSLGGFDCVIGNPPYVKYERLSQELQNYTKEKHNHLGGSFDIFQLFLDKAYFILKPNGLNGFIFPNVFLRGISYAKSREFFYKNSYIKIIRDYGDGVFEQASVATLIFIYSKEKRKNRAINFYIKKDEDFKNIKVAQEKFFNNSFLYLTDTICQKIQNGFNHIEDIAEITRGLEIGKDRIIENKNDAVEILFGEDIERYYIRSKKYIKKSTYKKFAKDENIFKKEKIIIREMSDRIMTVYDNSGIITNRSLYCIRSDVFNVKYILAILNSKLMGYYYNNTFKADTSLSKIRIGQIRQFPIPYIDLNKKHEKSQHDKLVLFVDKMLELNKKIQTLNSPHDKEVIKRQIDAIDTEIDKIVYGLYGLSDEEIKVVEGE